LKTQALKVAQTNYGLKSAQLLLDVKTYWNSTLTMLERIIKNKQSILDLLPLLTPDTLPAITKEAIFKQKCQLTEYQWETMSDLCKILLLFRLATKGFEGTKSTLSLAVPIIKWLIEEFVNQIP